MKLGYIGIDQHNQHYNIEKYPLKELMEQTAYTSSKKMYVDTKGDKIKHVGYVLTHRGYNALWINVYEIHVWKDQ